MLLKKWILLKKKLDYQYDQNDRKIKMLEIDYSIPFLVLFCKKVTRNLKIILVFI